MADICSICKDPLQNFRCDLMCGHSFHKECLKPFIRQRKMCPDCFKPIYKKRCSGYEFFTLTDNMQCEDCYWIPKKLVTFTPDFVKVEHILNHHCDGCQYHCRLFRRNFKCCIDSIRNSLNPVDESLVPKTKPRPKRNERELDAYDYLRCKKCHYEVIGFHDEDFEYSIRNSPNKVKGCYCREGPKITYGKLKEKTYQELPVCRICNLLIEETLFFRFCCPSTPLHFDCSLKQSMCPGCKTECKLSWEIPKSEPTMPNIIKTFIKSLEAELQETKINNKEFA